MQAREARRAGAAGAHAVTWLWLRSPAALGWPSGSPQMEAGGPGCPGPARGCRAHRPSPGSGATVKLHVALVGSPGTPLNIPRSPELQRSPDAELRTPRAGLSKTWLARWFPSPCTWGWDPCTRGQDPCTPVGIHAPGLGIHASSSCGISRQREIGSSRGLPVCSGRSMWKRTFLNVLGAAEKRNPRGPRAA